LKAAAKSSEHDPTKINCNIHREEEAVVAKSTYAVEKSC
jgi:hypothetical protein